MMQTDTMLLNAESATLDKQALVQLYEDHSPGIFRYAYRMLGDSHLAEDCVAETFSRLLLALKNGQGPGENPRAYLYTVAHNWITDHYRRRPAVMEELHEELHVDPFGNPEQEFSLKQRGDRMRQALMRLPGEQRQVVLLRFVENWSHEQVAVVMDKSVEATRAIQYRALAALRRMLVDQEEGRDGPKE